ncbi:hypothetical protein [Lentibacillus cibarius]|uniref:hypothetical protein n=1 Tax=Lentibacillus cibarius TaxID=2583219 RepID=UPI001486B5C8|nr:hypothetical protein [Lentibacillus cibarius]
MEVWNNQAALGYTIAAAKKISLTDDAIQDLIKAMHSGFDMKTIEEAIDIYRKSSY